MPGRRSKICSEFDSVCNSEANVTELNLAEENGGKRKTFVAKSIQNRIERAAGKRSNCAIAFAFQENFRNEIFVDVDLTGDIDLGAQEKFSRLNANLDGKRSRTARAYRQAHFLERNSVPACFASADLRDCFFQLQLSYRNRYLTIAHFLYEQHGLAICVSAFV